MLDDGSAEKYRNSEWRKRDFEEDTLKNMLSDFKTTVRSILSHNF